MRLIIAGIAILLWGAAAQADERQEKEEDTDAESEEVELVLSAEHPCLAVKDCGGPILLEIPEKDTRKQAEPMPGFFASLMVTSFADFASTEIALRNGAEEANPLMQNRGVRIAASVAAPLAVYYVGKKLGPKTRIALYIGVSVGWAYVAMHNVNQ